MQHLYKHATSIIRYTLRGQNTFFGVFYLMQTYIIPSIHCFVHLPNLGTPGGWNLSQLLGWELG